MPLTFVRLRKPTQVFLCKCDICDLNRNEHCIVRSERGLEFATCLTSPRNELGPKDTDAPLQFVRKATPTDISTLHQIEIEEKKAREVCLRKIEENNLPMKLVETEYTFDRHRITFYFTADDRVDFRELVKQLAQELHVRIELRHIPVRDEAKLVGGIGVCGLTLCCSTWLREFQPISMKMAKRQNLSLNPTKISGQCGRLLCCLGYENDLYPSKKDRGEADTHAEVPYGDWEEDSTGENISSLEEDDLLNQLDEDASEESVETTVSFEDEYTAPENVISSTYDIDEEKPDAVLTNEPDSMTDGQNTHNASLTEPKTDDKHRKKRKHRHGRRH